jgi:hypothetical protein
VEENGYTKNILLKGVGMGQSRLYKNWGKMKCLIYFEILCTRGYKN